MEMKIRQPEKLADFLYDKSGKRTPYLYEWPFDGNGQRTMVP